MSSLISKDAPTIEPYPSLGNSFILYFFNVYEEKMFTDKITNKSFKRRWA